MSSSPATDVAAMPDDSHEDRQGAAAKRKRNLPGTPDPEAEVIALSPKTLMATNRFLCEVCGKGFQRDQNLQLHRRGHNLPWKLKQRDQQEVKRRVYVCPESSCIHHDPSRALGDLTGIKKHFSRKHGEKKWKCEKCSKRYAVHSDWKAHLKVCGTREYRCDCGTLFSRRDNFVTHRAFCDALAQENAKAAAHRLIETHQSSDTGGNVLTSSARDLSSIVEASPLLFQQEAASERRSSEIAEPSVKDAREVSSTITECKGPTGLQCVRSSTSRIGVIGSGLSLSLGTGLGPGPPCPSNFISSFSQPLAVPSVNMMGKVADAYPDRIAKIQSPLNLASAGMYTNLLAGTSSDLEFHQPERNTLGRIGETCLSMTVSPMTDAQVISQFANSTYSNNGFFIPKHQRQHVGSAQLPATTLLQKAALMGATKSNPFLYRSLGDLCAISSQESRERIGKASVDAFSPGSWYTSSLEPSLHVHSSGVPRYGQEGRQEFRDDSGVPRLECISSGSSSSSSSVKSFLAFNDQKDHETVVPHEIQHGGSRLSSFNFSTCTELGEVQTEESNRLTLDFLGIGDGGSAQESSSNPLDAGARPQWFFHENDT